MGVLVGAPLPRRMRIGKEDLEREPLRQLFVLGPFFAPIIGQHLPQWNRDMPQLLREAFAGSSVIHADHTGQDH